MFRYMLVALMLAVGPLFAFDKVRAYKSVCEDDADKLNRTVEVLIAEGWQPFGAMAAYGYGFETRISRNHTDAFCQAMVKYAPTPAPTPTVVISPTATVTPVSTPETK